jgi:uncharacterized membrane protein YfcA
LRREREEHGEGKRCDIKRKVTSFFISLQFPVSSHISHISSSLLFLLFPCFLLLFSHVYFFLPPEEKAEKSRKSKPGEKVNMGKEV